MAVDAQQFANGVAAKLAALGMNATVAPWDAKDPDGNLTEPGAYVVTPSSPEWHNIPQGPSPDLPHGGLNPGVSPSVISPLAVGGAYTPEAWALTYFKDAQRALAILKAMNPTLGQGVYVNGHWYASQTDVPAPDAPPVPYVPPPVRPGGIQTPFGVIYPPDADTAVVVPDKSTIKRLFSELMAKLGL